MSLSNSTTFVAQLLINTSDILQVMLAGNLPKSIKGCGNLSEHCNPFNGLTLANAKGNLR